MALVLHVLRGSLAEGLENSKSDIDDAMLVDRGGTMPSYSYPCVNLVRFTVNVTKFKQACRLGDITSVSLLHCPVIYANSEGQALIDNRRSYVSESLYKQTLSECSVIEARELGGGPNPYPKGKQLTIVLKMLWWLYTAKTEQGLQVRPNEKLAKELKELRAGKCGNYQTLLNDLMKKVNKVWNK